jgi:hypothetical protein
LPHPSPKSPVVTTVLTDDGRPVKSFVDQFVAARPVIAIWRPPEVRTVS